MTRDQAVIPNPATAHAVPARQPGAVRATPALAFPKDDAVLQGLLMLLIVSFFAPSEMFMSLGSVNITPTFAVLMLLFPLLLINGRIKWDWPDFAALGIFLCFFVSMILSAEVFEAIESFGRAILTGYAPYIVGRYVIQNPERTKKFLSIVITVTSVLALFAVLESVYRFNVHARFWGLTYRPHDEQRLGMTRAYGWTAHSIMYGLVNAILLPVVVVCIMEKAKFAGRMLWFKLFALLLGCFLSLSTGAWAPALLSVMFVGWDYLFKVKPAVRWLIAYGGFPLTYGVLELASGRPLMRIIMMNFHLSNPTAWHYRWRLYERVFAEMPGHWLFGHGLVTPRSFQRGYTRSIDNHYLYLLLQYGIVGMSAWILVVLLMIGYGARAVWGGLDTPYVRFVRALMFGVIGVLVTQLSVALFSLPETLYWILIGMYVGGVQNCEFEARVIRQQVAKRHVAGARRRQFAHAMRAGAEGQPAVAMSSGSGATHG